MSAIQPSDQVSLFLSYAPEDEGWLKKVEAHLKMLKRQGIISTWHDRQIVPGTNRAGIIDQRLEQASLILLLVSVDFLASDYCYEVEMTRALALHASGRARVIPIVVRPVNWKDAPFAHLQPLPTDAKAISTWKNEDEALVDVVAGLRRALDDLSFSPASAVHRTLPPIWMIPYPRNPFFLGRDEVLVRVHTHLHRGQGQAIAFSQPHAISGLGGIGKTQLAIEYAYRYHQDYEAVLWARAEDHEALIASYIALATRLRLPERESKESAVIIEAVKVWLHTHQKWLLLLDNADDLDLLPPFLPPSAGGHLLITTRASAMQRLATLLEVEPLSDEQGAVLLLSRAGLLTAETEGAQASHEDRRVATLLAHELGGLPLALDQAGAYIEANALSVQEYHDLYRTHRLRLFRERRSRIRDHPDGVVTTWSLAFQRVQENHPAAADLLRLCAYLAPDVIAEELLTADASVLGPVLALMISDPFQRHQAVEALRTYSLIRRDPREKMLSVHRLVQAVLQETLEEPEQRIWAERAMQAINAAFPEAEHATWAQCERLLVQALRATQLIEEYHLTSWEAARILSASAAYLQGRARYREAEPLYQRALAIWEQSLGPDHPDVASSLYGLANLYSDQGKYSEAEPLYQRALAIWEQSLSPDHPDVAYPLNGLASLYSEQGKYSEAEPLYQRALAIWEQSLGPDHPDVASSLYGLANLYFDQGKYNEAEPLYQRALAIREQSLSPDHPDVASPLYGLASLYSKQGKYSEAEPLYQRALAIWEQSLGPDHPDVAYPLNGLATLYFDQGKYSEAEPLYQRALAIWEQSLGPDHPDVASPLYGLATLYSKQGKYSEAEPLYQRALAIREQSLGPDHSLTRQVQENYRNLLHMMKHGQNETDGN